MNGVDPSVGMLAHIRHAEGWLRRARADYLRGNGPQALLRLLLAEAEIRRARESAVGTVAAPPRRSPASLWTILGTVALAGALLAVYTVIRPPVPSPAARVSAASHSIPIGGRGGVLRFESGQVLPFVGVPAGIRPGGRTGPGNAVGIDADPLLTNDDGPTPVTFH